MRLLNTTTQSLSRLSRLNLLLFAIAASTVPALTFVINSSLLHPAIVRLGAMGLAVLTGTIFLRAYYLMKSTLTGLVEQQPGWGTCLAAALVISSSLYLILSYIPEISNYPFTLTWSEASRYYYASLYFSEQIYGIKAAPTVLHPSRYLLQAVPFLLSDSPIWLHRAWQVLLWITAPLLTSYLLARRLQIPTGLGRWLLIAAAYLFWMVGPVYYHLLVPVMIMIWGFHTFPVHSPGKRFAVSVLAVFFASAWAGVSRVNWYPVPGLIAAALILMEEPVQSKMRRAIWKYLLRLAGWAVFGTAIAFLSQIGYILWSGNSAEQFTTSFSSSLLWHRLLPNATYPPGLLLAILIVSLPMVALIFVRIFTHPTGKDAWKRFHPLRLLGLSGILLVFFAGGMVVSVKIGGGSNLHNLDAFMAFLLLISCYFHYGRVVEEPEDPGRATGIDAGPQGVMGKLPFRAISRTALAGGLILYAASAILTHVPASAYPDPKVASENLSEIATPVNKAVQSGGEVLFLSNRQLITFDYLKVPLVPEYERVFLMEAAMANDPVYLGKLHQELAEQRYALIISEPLSRDLKGAKTDFGAENNAWVINVSRHILCYYSPIKTLRPVQIQILAPAEKPKPNCP